MWHLFDHGVYLSELKTQQQKQKGRKRPAATKCILPLPFTVANCNELIEKEM